MTTTLGELAALVGGQLSGDAATPICGAAILRDVRDGEITLADNSQLVAELEACSAAAAVVPAGFPPSSLAHISVDDVHASFAKIVQRFRPPSVDRTLSGTSPEAHVSRSAQIGKNVTIHAGATIGEGVSIGDHSVIHPGVHLMAGCQIGASVTIFPNAVLYEDTVVGDRVVIHAGAILGAYGFGYRTTAEGHQRSAQLGFVEIGDDVEIGACTTVDRGTYGATQIGSGTKIDNQVMIAHNCRIGRHNLICSQVGVAGSCTTGDYVVMAGQVGLRDHIDIGDHVQLGAKSGVSQSVPSGQTYIGIPATPERAQMLKQAAWSRLPEMRKELKVLQKRVAELEQLRRDAA